MTNGKTYTLVVICKKNVNTVKTTVYVSDWNSG